jgi:1-acyl-sn-glycerol-3-phosphate acyltransferase|tara:strand:+ start:539 stop:1249 length:711 start_codon:yes stop_codon:yes gene_type:complete
MYKTIVSIILWPIFMIMFVLGVAGYFILTTFISLQKAHSYMKWFCRICLFSAGQILRIEGSIPEKEKQPYIYMFNHESMFDHFMIVAATSHYLTGVAAEDQYSYPVYGAGLRRYKAIPIKRDKLKAAIHSLDEAESVIKDGTSLLIAPEGTRTITGKMGTFKKGPFHLAKNTRATIIPVALIDAWRAKSKTDWRLQPGVITVRFGDPVLAIDYEHLTLQELSDHIRNQLTHLISKK